jgi:hypothetical protein
MMELFQQSWLSKALLGVSRQSTYVDRASLQFRLGLKLPALCTPEFGVEICQQEPSETFQLSRIRSSLTPFLEDSVYCLPANKFARLQTKSLNPLETIISNKTAIQTRT